QVGVERQDVGPQFIRDDFSVHPFHQLCVGMIRQRISAWLDRLPSVEVLVWKAQRTVFVQGEKAAITVQRVVKAVHEHVLYSRSGRREGQRFEGTNLGHQAQ